MTKDEKIAMLKEMLNPDVPTDSELSTLLTITELAILNRRYPQGYTSNTEVPSRYVGIQLQCCVALYNKKGVEGQTAHNENGISRTYDSGDIPDNLLKKIMPMCGSVIDDAGLQ